MLLTIASVPWRENDLVKLIDKIGAQTVLPDRLLIVLDNYDHDAILRIDAHLDTLPESIRTHLCPCVPKQGNWMRYRIATELFELLCDDDDPFFMIDDDLSPCPDYLERGLEILKRCDAFSWYAYAPGSRYGYSPKKHAERDIPAIHITSGALGTRLGYLRGMFASPVAARFQRTGSHDEALMSWWLWIHGRKMIRPKGSIELVSAESQHDARSNHSQHQDQLRGDYTYLVTKFGWPGSPNNNPKKADAHV